MTLHIPHTHSHFHSHVNVDVDLCSFLAISKAFGEDPVASRGNNATKCSHDIIGCAYGRALHTQGLLSELRCLHPTL